MWEILSPLYKRNFLKRQLKISILFSLRGTKRLHKSSLTKKGSLFSREMTYGFLSQNTVHLCHKYMAFSKTDSKSSFFHKGTTLLEHVQRGSPLRKCVLLRASLEKVTLKSYHIALETLEERSDCIPQAGDTTSL